VDGGRACGQPFQEAAVLLLDPEEPDEPDPAEPDDDDPAAAALDFEDPVDEPEPDESEEDDDVDFCSPLPLSLLAAAFGFSRLSVR
jgi:hypothetical protein